MTTPTPTPPSATESDRALAETIGVLWQKATKADDDNPYLRDQYMDLAAQQIAAHTSAAVAEAVKQAVESVNEQWETWGAIEVAVRNDSVQEYMRHWETRATKAESDRESLRACVVRLREALEGAEAAFIRYEIDVDVEAPSSHVAMMQRIDTALREAGRAQATETIP